MSNLNLKDMLANAIYKRFAESSGITKSESGIIADHLLASIKKSVEDGEPVRINGVGEIYRALKPPTNRRNPKTGEKFMKPAYFKAQFRPAGGARGLNFPPFAEGSTE